MFPTTIKTGLNGGDPALGIRGSEFEKRVSGLVLVLMRRATRAMQVFMEHACTVDIGESVFKRSQVLRVFGRAFQYVTIPFFTAEGLEEELEDMTRRMDEVETELSSEEEEEEEEDDDEEEEEEEEDRDAEYFNAPEKNRVDLDATENRCTCETCAGILGADASFNAWNPTDQVEILLKTHVADTVRRTLE